MSAKRAPLSTVVRKPFTRRDLVKAAPVGAALAGLGVVAAGRLSSQPLTTTKGTCRFCLMHCGIVGHTRGTRLEKVEGDRTSRTRGFLCEHGFALREMVHSGARLQRPLVRRGDTFHEVSWSDALDEVATKLLRVKATHGPEALLIQTGWPMVRHPLVNWLHRFARAFGSPNVSTVASLCEAALRMGQALTVGSKYSADVRSTKTLVLWGSNPGVTAPPFLHVIAKKADGGNLIVIDPVRTTLAREATTWIPIRPGTDGALALGVIHLVLENGWYDKPFMEANTRGLDELRALAAKYPVPEVERLTSVPAKEIESLARRMAQDTPTGVWAGLGVEHHENGVQTLRAICALEVLVGRFDGRQDARSVLTPPGPDFREVMLPALYPMTTPTPVPPEPKAQPLGRAQYPLYEMYNREAQGQLLADAVLREGPGAIRAVMLLASNALVTSQGTQRLEEAAEKLDLLVTIDPFFTASARRSDVVLPATTFAESPDVDEDDRVADQSLVAPQGEAKPDWTILVELARRLGLSEYFPWATMHEAARQPHVPFMQDVASQPRPVPTVEAPRFGTPSGRAEFASQLLEQHGHPGLPEWTAPTEQPTAEFPLRLVTGPRPRAYINSQFHDVPSVNARMRTPEVLLHPSVATPLGITTGATVALTSPHGRITLTAVVTEGVHPECAVMPAGFAEANPNRLISPTLRDPISGFPAFRSGICRVEKPGTV
ncbi:MAG: molybdopterin-dependent oxidoreductase [Myxococcaceae bacterium]|nr:molybdopterin-dependent oxidoreductase [Myxococcaceae bacterium]